MTALRRHGRVGTAAPTWWASWAVRSASVSLPSDHRYRYRQEFLAELHGMTPSEQLHHASGVLSRAWTLRVALNEPARLMAKEAAMAQHWRCRIRLHRYQRLRNPEGGWYRECRDCGKQGNVMGGPPSMAGPSAGGF